jgi:uncharacterized BrkB/YihY/UPF0761 family membrane protein
MRWVFGVLVVCLFGYQGYALWSPVDGDTISEMVWGITLAYPVVIFFAGFLCGHWFWPKRPKRIAKWHSPGN